MLFGAFRYMRVRLGFLLSTYKWKTVVAPMLPVPFPGTTYTVSSHLRNLTSTLYPKPELILPWKYTLESSGDSFTLTVSNIFRITVEIRRPE